MLHSEFGINSSLSSAIVNVNCLSCHSDVCAALFFVFSQWAIVVSINITCLLLSKFGT